MKKAPVLILAVFAVIVSVGLVVFFQNSNNEEDNDTSLSETTPREQQPASEREAVAQTPEEQLAVMKEAIAEAKQFETDDLELYYWLIRVISEAKTFGIELSDEELLIRAQQERENLNQFIAFAASHYDVSFSEAEVDEFLKEQLRIDESTMAEYMPFADLMGMTMEEFIFEFERDRNTQTVVWTHLQPVLEEKYAREIEKAREASIKQNTPFNVNGFLLEMYETEFEEHYK